MNNPQNNKSPIPAVLYGRVSTDKQDMERQDRTLPDYCARNSLVPVARIYDPDTSGSIPFKDRSGGRKVLEELKTRSQLGPIALVTTEQDRIGRDSVDIISTIRTVWELGSIPHFAAEGGAIERTPETEMYVGMRANAAQYERDKIRQRIRSKFKTKRDYNELCGTVSYGWDAQYFFADGFKLLTNRALAAGQGKDKDDVLAGLIAQHGRLLSQTLVPNQVEQQWILHMKRLRDAKWGYHSIAKNLNENNVPTKRPAGELMQLRNEEGATESSTKRFVSGKWQCGNVAKVLASKMVQKWLQEQCEPCQKVA
jgi:hypothetical protein